MFGVVRTASGGRCLVDFNHPLAGKDLVYKVRINKIIDDDKEKLKSLLKAHLNAKDAEVELSEGNATVKAKQKIPKEAVDDLKAIALRTIPGIKIIDFAAEEKK